MGLGTHRHARTIALATLFALAAAGCSDSGLKSQDPPSRQSASPTSTIDPRAAAAVEAYKLFSAAANRALEKPFSPKDKPPVDADFSRYAFDPWLASYQSEIYTFDHEGVFFKGTPPMPRVHVVAIALDASPWPTVTLGDCAADSKDWHAYYSKTGGQVPETTPTVRFPWEQTITMIEYKGRWGAQKIAVDESRTCTA